MSDKPNPHLYNPKSILDDIERWQKGTEELRQRTQNLRIYGYSLPELLEIIHYAKAHGYRGEG